ncbi:MAG TPA: UbiA family prenyltransferase [Nitrososphaera sp.]|nr:UbiA family prenyltransferase [Nitrososphaera sp.]
MQHPISSRIRQYLLLIRLPNVFTAPPDIAVGYFAAVGVAGIIDIVHLAALMIASGLLYSAGIIFNDYFDIEIDKKERPFRPLPSGSVSKRDAMAIALVAFALANAISFAIGFVCFVVSIALSAIIIAYDYRLKHSAVAGPFAMGGARFLNVILGASAGIATTAIDATVPLLTGPDTQHWAVVFASAASLFAYVVAITILSKREVGGIEKTPSLIPFFIVFAIIASIAAMGLLLLKLQWVFLINLSLFTTIMTVTFKRYIIQDSPPSSIQKAIRNMIISIIILDSVFVSGIAGLTYGLATLLFVIPALLLAKRLYVT